ncbi:MAG: CDP-glycerol glycerophosphotransferase family protein [Vagococcus sp.]|uniref:bifunctional glycosyltransferase/CDP-glycerol:glycerophosphate glycerophosphotransferase n=1 Tax=Vagococcus sp. TaxID=1933889 RepID=UPI002FC5F262
MEKINYQVSIIIPIYNVEDYLAECIDSVIKQTEFKKSKVLLINDGSPDKSGEIAKSYADKYDNIFYYEKQNGGLSSARNYGMKYVDTDFVMFLDSDDLLPHDAVANLLGMIKSDPELEIVMGDLEMFPVKTPKYLWKFSFGYGDFIMDDLSNNPEILSAPSACNKIFRVSSFLEHDVMFPEGLHFEDAYAIIPMMLKVKKIGICDKVVYLYREREDNSSIMDGIFQRKKSYLDHLTVNEHIKEILDENSSEELTHMIYNFIVRTYTGFLIRIPSSSLFTIEEKKDLFERLKKLFAGIPQVVEERYLDTGIKRILLISLLINDFELFLNPRVTDPGVNILKNKASTYFDNKYPVEFTYNFMVEELEFKDNHIELLGQLNSNMYYPDDELGNRVNFKLNTGENTIPLKATYYKRFDKKVLTKDEFYWGIKLEIPYDKIKNELAEYTVISEVRDLYSGDKMVSKVSGGPYLNKRQGFRDLGNGRRVRFTTFGGSNFVRFNITKSSKIETFKYNMEKIFKSKTELQVGAKMRLMYWASRPFLKHKDIVLIAERTDTYQDNSSVLFDYVSEKHPNLPIYYLIDKKTEAYKKIKNKKNVIEIDSLKHYMYLLNANVLVNAYDIDTYMIPTSYTKSAYYRLFGDLLNYKRLFLQHGISYNDVSWGLSKPRVGNDKVVVSNKNEENFFIEKAGYQPENMLRTGFTRYDRLTPHIEKFNDEKVILLMPTWRDDFAKKSYLKNDVGISNKDFVQTAYYNFYNDLMNDDRLVAYLEENNVTLKVYLHYELNDKLNLFKVTSDRVKIIPNGQESVQKLLITSDLLITDYSSVFYDFLYMRKPVVFTPFDYEEFYSKHYKHGYLNILDERLGRAVNQVDDAVTEVIKTLDNGCQLSPEVQRNIAEDFIYKVNNSNEAVLEEIQNLIKESKKK